jgi:hypothetical protein
LCPHQFDLFLQAPGTLSAFNKQRMKDYESSAGWARSVRSPASPAGSASTPKATRLSGAQATLAPSSVQSLQRRMTRSLPPPASPSQCNSPDTHRSRPPRNRFRWLAAPRTPTLCGARCLCCSARRSNSLGRPRRNLLQQKLLEARSRRLRRRQQRTLRTGRPRLGLRQRCWGHCNAWSCRRFTGARCYLALQMSELCNCLRLSPGRRMPLTTRSLRCDAWPRYSILAWALSHSCILLLFCWSLCSSSLCWSLCFCKTRLRCALRTHSAQQLLASELVHPSCGTSLHHFGLEICSALLC